MSSARSLGGLGVGVVLAAVAATAVAAGAGQAASCAPPKVPGRSATAVEQALASGRDIWGDELLRSPAGPTYAGIQHRLSPLLLVGRPAGTRGTKLTDSGVYYIPFGQPTTGGGEDRAALHVADGSEIVSGRADGPRLAVYVDGARERYGSCLSRLATPALAAGYLPILQTSYTSSTGVHLGQESFAARVPGIGSLVSFVRLTVDARRQSSGPTRIRFVPSIGSLRATGNQLRLGGKTVLLFGAGGHFDRSSLDYTVASGRLETIYVAWLVRPVAAPTLALDAQSYGHARASLVAYWRRRLLEGAQIVVPERRVLDAERNLLIQNMTMGWRYSLGNDYQTFEFPESLDGAAVMAGYGFPDVARATLETALARPIGLYPAWNMGDELLAAAAYYDLSGDGDFLARATPILSRYVADLARLRARDPHHLLRRERYASDLTASVYGLNNHAVVWQGLRAIAAAWARADEPGLARQASTLAAQLGLTLRTAVRASVTKLDDGSLYLPVRLFDNEPAYPQLTTTKAGSYWNLVMPYALASGLIEPRTPLATGLLRYLLAHGSRLLGLVRFNYYPAAPEQTIGHGLPGYRSSGTDEVYGLHLARFLAANDQPDQLVLSLYGQLAAGMTAGTYVSGEGATAVPAPGASYREMYLPPNSIGNAAFLEKLRLMLVHETSDANGAPGGLELAYATPRGWLRAGKSIRLQRVPTSFGPLSYSIEARPRQLRVTVQVPERPPRELKLRLRLPRGERIARVRVAGSPARFDRATETVDLSGRTGTVSLVAEYR